MTPDQTCATAVILAVLYLFAANYFLYVKRDLPEMKK